jgi:nicotinamidase/pyrazinamidase
MLLVYDLSMKKRLSTLIIVDVQNDFLEGGSLAVSGADSSFVKSIEAIRDRFDQVVLTADNHPQDHISFGVFPPHCIRATKGAGLAVRNDGLLLLKGEARDTEEFSAFIDGKNISMITGDDVYVVGLAGDYCVRQTISDILAYAPGKRVSAIVDLIRSVDGTFYTDVDYFAGKVRFMESRELTIGDHQEVNLHREYSRRIFEALPEDVSKEQVERTVVSLERHHYDPLMILTAPGFLHWTKAEVLREYDRLSLKKLDDPELMAVLGESAESVVNKQLGLLLYHYNLLCRLRLGEASAWDVVNELYEDD